jgi:hypothetical protein
MTEKDNYIEIDRKRLEKKSLLADIIQLARDNGYKVGRELFTSNGKEYRIDKGFFSFDNIAEFGFDMYPTYIKVFLKNKNLKIISKIFEPISKKYKIKIILEVE